MKNKTLLVGLLLGITLLVVLNLPAPVSRGFKAFVRDVLAPVQSLVSDTLRWGREFPLTVRKFARLRDDQLSLSREVARLRQEVVALRALEQENRALREQLQFVRRQPRRLLPCELIGRDASGWWQSVRVAKKPADAIQADLAVVSAEGLVGKTTNVSARTCDVLLITDPACRISARVRRTGAFGIVSGLGVSPGGLPLCRMDFINKNLPLHNGDVIVTSGLGGVFPPDLEIGCLDRVRQDESGLYQSAEVVPSADLGRLACVYIVLENGAAVPGEAAP